MIVVDANLLLYAYDTKSERHDVSRAWLEETLGGPQLVRFTWVTLWAFLRISTSPRIFLQPLSTTDAAAAVSRWLAQPSAGLLEPGERHWEILQRLMKEGQIRGPRVMDAVLAALAVEHGVTLHTADRDFARFPGLKWVNPLAAE